MQLAFVTLTNFRGYQQPTRISLNDLTTIIGKNDVGKSTILEGLEIFFNNDTVRIEGDDRCVHSGTEFVEITCEFAKIPEEIVIDSSAPTTLRDEYLLNTNGFLCIKKRWRCTSAKPKEEVFVLAEHPTAEHYSDLLSLTQSKLRERMDALNVPSDGVNRCSNPEMRKAIYRTCTDLKLASIDVPVAKEDGKRIWEKLAMQLPQFALFQSDRPSRDSDSEIQDPMKLAVATALAEPEVTKKLADVVDAVRKKAVALADRTHQALAKLDDTLADQLTPEFKTDPKWAGLFSLSLNCDDGIPVNKRGSGVRRMILVSFFRAEAERRLAEGSSRSIIYAIEEPETAQHPHNQRILLDSFQQLASEPNCQVILSTHSPGFASFLPIDSFRFVRRDPNDGRRVYEGTSNILEEVAETLGIIPDNRVKVLLCVEGPTDVEALKHLSRALHVDAPHLPDLSCDPRIAFVVLGGGTLKHWVNHHYLRNLKRPEVHIYDNDVASYQESVDTVTAREDGSWGILTKKREIENYLHPDAISEGINCNLAFSDTDDVPALIGQHKGWKASTTKRKLAAHAFPLMTASRIAERDQEKEVEGWMHAISEMLD